MAYADAALVEVFINSHIVNNTLIMKCFILICSVETLSMHRINSGVHRVCRIEYTQEVKIRAVAHPPSLRERERERAREREVYELFDNLSYSGLITFLL